MCNSSIAELVRLARQGDNEAKSELCRRTYDLAYFSAFKMLKDYNNSIDVVQSSFLQALSSMDALRKDNRFESWITSIVLNKCKDLLKRKKPMLFTEMSNGESDTDVDFADDKIEYQPELNLDANETNKIIDNMIDALPEDQRACVLMYYFNELSIAEIARVLEISENTVKSRLSYGRKKIKAQVLDVERETGVKLYSVPAIPFFVWLLRQQAAITHVSPEVVEKTIKAVTAVSVAATGAAVVGTTGVGVAAVESASITGAGTGTGTVPTVAAITSETTSASVAAVAESVAVKSGAAATVTSATSAPTAVTVVTIAGKAITIKAIAIIAAGIVAVTGTIGGVVAYQHQKQNEPEYTQTNLDVDMVKIETNETASKSSESSNTANDDDLIEKFVYEFQGYEIPFPAEWEKDMIFEVSSNDATHLNIYATPESIGDTIKQLVATLEAKEGLCYVSLTIRKSLWGDIPSENVFHWGVVDTITSHWDQYGYYPLLIRENEYLVWDGMNYANWFIGKLSDDYRSHTEKALIAKKQEMSKWLVNMHRKTVNGYATMLLDTPIVNPELTNTDDNKETDLKESDYAISFDFDATDETFTHSFYGHDVEFPIEYKDKLDFRQGVDSMGDSFAQVFYKPIRDINSSGGELMYMDLWTRNYYDPYIKDWYNKCVNQGYYTDPIPNQWQISFKPDTILVAMFNNSSTSGASADDIADYNKLVEWLKKYCEDQRKKVLPLDQPNYDTYLKGWFEGLPLSSLTSGETFTQNILGYNVEFPASLKGKLIFEHKESAVILYHKPMYEYFQQGGKMDDGNANIGNSYIRTFFLEPKSEYDQYIIDWHIGEAPGPYGRHFTGPVSINKNEVLCTSGSGDGPWDGDKNLLDDYYQVRNQIVIWFNDRVETILKSDQPNYDLYVKGNEDSFHFG